MFFFTLTTGGVLSELLFGYAIFFIPTVIILSVVSIKKSETPLVMVDDKHILCIENRRFSYYLVIVVVLLVGNFSVSLFNNDDVLLAHDKVMFELYESDNYVEDLVTLTENPNTLMSLEKSLEQIIDGESNVVYGTTFIKYIDTVYEDGNSMHTFNFVYHRVNDDWKLIRLASESWTTY